MDDLSSEEMQANASLIFDKSGELSNITVIPVQNRVGGKARIDSKEVNDGQTLDHGVA